MYSASENNLLYLIMQIMTVMAEGNSENNSSLRTYDDLIIAVCQYFEEINTGLISDYELEPDFDILKVLFGAEADIMVEKLYCEVYYEIGEVRLKFTPVKDGADDEAYLIVSADVALTDSDRSMTVETPDSFEGDEFMWEELDSFVKALLQSLYIHAQQ